ncbi:MAG: homocysteine biosynthesis protein [Candidatus Bathyarchaeota archaeon]|nr:homocysteine biosynthesis protein [Candidatus Bathyarchaeota archaeon]
MSHEQLRTVEEINRKIESGDAVVLTTEEMNRLVESKGVKVAAEEVDVVTTGTFGAMCSSGAIINLGHADPPIKIQKAWINGVEVCHPGAAVDLYIGATMTSETQPFEYGGGHVIEDLIRGKSVELRAISHGTDCYPRTRLETTLTKDDLNQFYLLNFRNCYQRYDCATNGRDEAIYTYMGKLLPHYGNASFSGAGSWNPLCNDPDYETIGVGTRIFLGGAQGYVIGEGTQHNPGAGFGTLMVKGDGKKMSSEYVRGVAFTNYGTTLYVGIGIPIPILNEGLAEKTAVRDEEIVTDVVDYGVPRRDRPTLRKVNYRELKSGKIVVKDREVKVSPLSSLKKAKAISEVLKKEISDAAFFLTAPVETLPRDTVVRPMRQTREVTLVEALIRPAVTCRREDSIESVAERIIHHSVNHIVVVDEEGRLEGIVTSWDITRAIANGCKKLTEIVTRRVITAVPTEPIDGASRRMAQHNISALPVIDERKRVLGILTAENLSKLIGG